MTSFRILHAAGLLVALTSSALAQPPAPTQSSTMTVKPNAPMPGMATASPGPGANPSTPSQSTNAFKAADDKMMREMARPMTGNADQDFVAGMLPHHVGAVDMARVEIQYGKDPEMLRLARGIIAAQEKEIAQMQTWQKKHPKP
jgi:uncharacterized protein (DUF305 family)